MKKILFLNTVYKTGGAAKIAHQIFEFLDKKDNYDVCFAYGRGLKEKNNKVFKFGNKLEFYFHVFLVRFLGLEGFGSYFSTRKLIKFIKKEKFDVIHIHNVHGYYVNFFKLLSWLNKKNIKVIWTLHDEWVLTWLPAHSMGCEHCLSGNGVCINKYSYPRNYFPIFKRLMIKRKKGIFDYNNIEFFSPAIWLCNKVKLKYPKANINLIFNSVNTELFYPKDKRLLKEKYNLPSDKKIIIFSAIDLKNENKGVGFALEVVKSFLKNDNYYFISFGGGKMPEMNNLYNFGLISDKNIMSDLYALSDLYIFPSLAETASLSVLEAMSSGLPILAFAIPANIFLQDYNCGYLLKNFSAKDLVKKIDNIFLDEDKLAEISRNCREISSEKFNSQLMYNNYLELY